MPITKRQFQLGIDDDIDSLMRQVYELLVRRAESAFSTGELTDALLGQSPSHGQRQALYAALETLSRIKAIEKRTVSREDYYAFSNKFEVGTWNLDLSGV